MAKEEKKENGKVAEFRQKHFFHLEKAVKPSQIYADRIYFEKNLRVGFELECSNIPGRCEEIGRLLRATVAYNDINSFVHRVYMDGSVTPNGVEVVFKGSMENFSTYLENLSDVEKKMKSLLAKGRIINNSTSSCHITLLTSQNKEIPDTYLANFYQLYRKYCDALLWLSSATYEPREPELHPEGRMNKNRIIRKGISHFGQPLMIKSPQFNTVKDIAHTYGKYYGMYFKESTEYQNDVLGVQHWMANGNPNGLCVEFRFPDRIPVPSATVSLKCLLQAMLFKSLDLSEFGIMNVEANGEGDWGKTKAMIEKICLGQELTKQDIKYLQSKSDALIDFVYPNLKSFDGQSIEVLRKLAELPVSLRYACGDDDSRIIRELTPKKSLEFETERTVRNLITLQLVKAKSAGEWRKKAAKEVGISERMVIHTLTRISRFYNVSYDKELQGYILVV